MFKYRFVITLNSNLKGTIMKNILMAAALAVTALTQTAHAGLLITGTGTDNAAISPKNDFKTVFAHSSGDFKFNAWSTGVGLKAANNIKVTFYYLGSEAAFSDNFNINGSSVVTTPTGLHKVRAGYPTWTSATAGSDPLDIGGSIAPTALNLGTIKITTGTDLSGLIDFSSNHTPSADGHLSTTGFGVFYSGGVANKGADHGVLGFGYDDQKGGNADGNHDDVFIVAVTSTVPEASTWMMMLLGFGVAGYGLRSRNRLMQTA